MNAFIFHGVYGHNNENWFPWLKDKLEENSIETTTLNFPTPVDQTLNNWMRVVAPYKDQIDINTIIIGHSLGSLFSAHLLSIINKKIHGLFLVAPFTRHTNDKEINKTLASFIDTPVNWGNVCKNSSYISIYASLDDPYVSLESSIEFARNIGLGKLNLYLNAGHFNQKANILQFPDLLDEILRI